MNIYINSKIMKSIRYAGDAIMSNSEQYIQTLLNSITT